MTDNVTLAEAVRIGLILIVFAALFRVLVLLHRDWPRIFPPYWRWIILAFHGVLIAVAIAAVMALTVGNPLTLGIWALVVACLVLFTVALITPRLHRVDQP